jgi:recombination protein RecA
MAFGKKKLTEEQQQAPKVVLAAPTTEIAKFERLFAISKAVDKKFSTTNSIIRMNTKNIVMVPSIPTLLPTFDNDVMSIGGVPRGRIVEIFGPESAGKTTITLWLIAQLQALGGLAAFVDAEHALDTMYASQLGVNIDKLLISQPDHGDQALHIVRELVNSQCVDLIVVDSVAALTPEAELLGDMGDNHVGLQPRMMAQALRIITAEADKNKTTVVFINQIREKIGVMFGNPETTPGGRALKHYASVRLDVRRKEEIKDGTEIIGHQLRLKAVKNKVGTPLRETIVDLYYPNTSHKAGFDVIADTITYAANKGLFVMDGLWYQMDLGNVDENKKALGIEKLAYGLPKLKDRLCDDVKAMIAVRKKISAFRKLELEAAKKVAI